MEIVIKIPDGIYDFLKEHPDRQFPYATEWIRHGTPLPKGHGRLKDADAFIKAECSQCDGNCGICDCDCLNCKSEWRCEFIKDIDSADVIVEADKEVDE